MNINNKTILLVDDDPAFVELLANLLEKEGYQTLKAYTGGEALESADKLKPDCMVLDYMLPDQTGIEVCKTIRSIHHLKTMPVIILTGHSRDKVGILKSGADHFLTKSEDTSELLATLIAVLRRQEMVLGILRSRDVTLNPQERQVFLGDRLVTVLTPKTFSLFYTLVERSPQAVSKEELFKILEDLDEPGVSRALDVLINRLRNALGEELASMIHSVKGYGYTFVHPE